MFYFPFVFPPLLLIGHGLWAVGMNYSQEGKDEVRYVGVRTIRVQMVYRGMSSVEMIVMVWVPVTDIGKKSLKKFTKEYGENTNDCVNGDVMRINKSVNIHERRFGRKWKTQGALRITAPTCTVITTERPFHQPVPNTNGI